MKTVKKIWNIFTTVLVAVVVGAAISLVGVRLFGFKVFTVLSGSMEPTYHTGSVIYVTPVDYRELRVGDPISFMLDEDTVATHRIVEIVPDEEDPDTLRYRTKGDANEAEDGGLVHYKNVIGKPVFSIPLLGYFVNYIQHPPGRYITVAGGAFLLLLLFLPELLSAAFSDEEGEPEKKPKEKKTEKPWPQPEQRDCAKPAKHETPVPIPDEPTFDPPAEKRYIEDTKLCYEEPKQLSIEDYMPPQEPEYGPHHTAPSAKHETRSYEKRSARPKKQKYVPRH